LNKKIPETKRIYPWLNSYSFTEITILTIAFAAINFFFQFSGLTAGFTFLTLFLISLIVQKEYPKSGLTIITLIALLTLQINLSATIIVLLGLSLILTHKVFSIKLQKFSFMIMSVITHIGDAVTTYIGVERGLNEVNPFMNLFLERYGSLAAFGVKATVVPIILYIYLELPKKQSELLLKSIYVIGLYLTANNILVI